MLGGLKVLVFLGVLSFFSYVMYGWLTAPQPQPVPPAPAPWSCAQALKDAALVDGGGQIAPLCGATPNPALPGNDGDGDGF